MSPNPENTVPQPITPKPEGRKYTRREALKFGGKALGLILLAACNPVGTAQKILETPAPIVSPTSTPLPPTRQPTAEALPQSTVVSSDFLVNGLSALGGENALSVPTAAPGGIRTETKTGYDLFSYASKVWDETVSGNTIGDPVSALKFVLAYSEMTGIEGKIDVSRTFSQLPLTLGRITIGNLPNNAPFEAIINASPKNLAVRKNTHMTIVGTYTNESGRWVTVAFDDFGRQDKDKNPRLFLASLPLTLENPLTGQTSLVDLLKTNGGDYDSSTGVITLPDGRGGKQKIGLNTIETNRFIHPESLSRKIDKAVGAYFVDTLGKNPDGTLILHPKPVVPYPPEDLVGPSYRLAQMEKDGTIVAYETNTNTIKATASYNKATNSWEWIDKMQQLMQEAKSKIMVLFQTQVPNEKGTPTAYAKKSGEVIAIVQSATSPTRFWYLSEDGKTLEEIRTPEFVKNITWSVDKDALSFVNDKGITIASWSDGDKVNLKQMKWNWDKMSEQEKKDAYQWNFNNIKFIKGQTPNITDEQFRRFDEMIRKSTKFMPKALPSPEETGINFPSKFPRELLPPFSIDTLFEASSKFKGFELTEAQRGFSSNPNTRMSLISTASFVPSPQKNFNPFDIYTYSSVSAHQISLLAYDNLSTTTLSSAEKQKIADAYATVFTYLTWNWIYDNYPNSIKKDYYDTTAPWINNTILSRFK